MTRRRIAVIGSGIAGLTAGYVLSRTDDVVLFEAERRLGGHAHTHQLGADGRPAQGGLPALSVDSGFIVHNRHTYPLLTRLLAELDVPVQPSEMSMSVTCAGCGLQYAGHRGLPGLAAGLPGGRVRYARMLAEVLRFHRAARRLIAHPDVGSAGGQDASAPELTLGQFLQAGGYSRYFITHFAMPFVAAVWSCPPHTALRYPARYLFTFLDHHGLLSVTGSPPWLTITGGSRTYTERVAKQLADVRTGTAVTAVRRHAGGAEVSFTDADGEPGAAGSFDAVVVATHPDHALRLIADPTGAERDVLGAFRYSRNDTVLHTDASVLPASPRVRSSWNYALRSCSADSGQVEVSYYMNRLQQLPAGRDYVVSLNPGLDIPDDQVIARMAYEHPVYDPPALAAQRRLPELNDGITAFAGAYHGWGFHEDGCRAGLAAAESLGGRW
jgi:predicted NAD/FAD-binding protein